MNEGFDIIVIGAGTAGLVVASGTSRFGARVALIERDRLGGECLWTGCVPSKALIRSARLISEMRRGADYGLSRQDPVFDFGAVMESMRAARDSVGRHDDPERFRKMGIEVIQGEATMLDRNRVRVDGRELDATKIVMATGSRPAVPPIPGLAEAGFITHVEVFELETMPRSLAVLGGGPIGIELAQVFRRFGCRVTVIEMLDRVLPREDREVSDTVAEILRSEGIGLILGDRVTAVEATGGVKKVSTESGAIVEVEEILVAAGRKANVEALDLGKTGVQTGRSGIEVDLTLRTNVSSISAAGDVTGKMLFTHVAEYQGRLLTGNLLFPFKRKASYRNVAWATYMDPEVAHIGLTEEEARSQIPNLKVMRYSMSDLDRAITERQPVGLIKLLSTPKGKLVGASIVGPNAGELIQVVGLAMANKIPVGKLSQAIRVYPTMVEGIERAADGYYKDMLDSRVGKFLKWLARRSLR